MTVVSGLWSQVQSGRNTSARGNALFLILIAVALFAALSYAVTRSGRGGGSVSKEQLDLDIAKFTQHLASLDYAVNRLRLINKCSENQVNFDNNHYFLADGSTHPNPLGSNLYAPADGSCNLFNPAGGNINFYELEPRNYASGFSTWGLGQMQMLDAPVQGKGTAADDLIITLSVNGGAISGHQGGVKVGH